MKSKSSVFDPFNNRILIKNSHKYVFKKVMSAKNEEWCQKYLTVASHKLTYPFKQVRMPVSLSKKKYKTQHHESNRDQQTQNNILCNAGSKKVAIITSLQEARKSDESELKQLMRNDRDLNRLSLKRRKFDKKSSFMIRRRYENVLEVSKKHENERNIRITKKGQNFELEPWSVQQEQKQNYFF